MMRMSVCATIACFMSVFSACSLYAADSSAENLKDAQIAALKQEVAKLKIQLAAQKKLAMMWAEKVQVVIANVKMKNEIAKRCEEMIKTDIAVFTTKGDFAPWMIALCDVGIDYMQIRNANDLQKMILRIKTVFGKDSPQYLTFKAEASLPDWFYI